MTSTNRTFSVEIVGDPSDLDNISIEIYLSRDCIRELIDHLRDLENSDDWDSIRLFSENWGGDDLTATPLRKGALSANALKIGVVPSDFTNS